MDTAQTCTRLLDELERAVVGRRSPRTGDARRPGRRARADRRPAGPRQDPAGPVVRAGARPGLHPDPVHPGPAALGRDRRAALRPAQRRDGVPAGTGLHPSAARRRDQPDPAQDPGRAAGGDGREPGQRGRGDPAAAGAVRGDRDRQPDRVRGHLQLPEAQLDRFLLRVRIGYLPVGDEAAMLRRRLDRATPEVELGPWPTRPRSLRCAGLEQVEVDDDLSTTSWRSSTRPGITRRSRSAPARAAAWRWSSSPAARAAAARDYVIPDDVKQSPCPRLRTG